MAKKTPLETDMARLQKKVTEQRTAVASSEDNPKLRSLHKRLKRAQRKNRRLAIRKQHAIGKKAGAKKAETTPA